jgi:hypothetical protein
MGSSMEEAHSRKLMRREFCNARSLPLHFALERGVLEILAAYSFRGVTSSR